MTKHQWEYILAILEESKCGYREVSRQAWRAVDDPAFRMEKFPTFTRQEVLSHYEVKWARYEKITENIRALEEVRDYYLGEK